VTPRTSPTPTETVRAAGGVVWRPGPDGDVEVLLVHRPKYDDWSLPKGKCAEGEDDLRCALREVEEETGLRCEPGEELASSSYRDAKGRPKTVRYWAMEPRSGSFAPHDEIDETRWLPRVEAHGQLSYERDREVLASLHRSANDHLVKNS
jgi:8-oxo-dGTP pyrophosphatase MutT (NUDIX family)